MKLKTWIERQDEGVLTRLQIKTGLAYTTVLRAVRAQGVSRRSAELISEATDDAVSPTEVLFNDDAAVVPQRSRKSA